MYEHTVNVFTVCYLGFRIFCFQLSLVVLLYELYVLATASNHHALIDPHGKSGAEGVPGWWRKPMGIMQTLGKLLVSMGSQLWSQPFSLDSNFEVYAHNEPKQNGKSSTELNWQFLKQDISRLLGDERPKLQSDRKLKLLRFWVVKPKTVWQHEMWTIVKWVSIWVSCQWQP